MSAELHSRVSLRSVRQVADLLPGIVSRHQFGTLGTIDLRQKMKEKGVPFEHDCVVFEVCNPKQAKAVLEGDMSVSSALPCRISVYEEKGKTVIATIRPTKLFALFGDSALEPVARDVEKTLVAIVDEAGAA